MGQTIDVRLELLTGRRARVAVEPNGKSFFIETFGCQMNAHDSEKVAGVLLARGYAQVPEPERADVVLYNTCSIREKAAQKVFSRLGTHRGARADKIIGVLGCVAQQEGEEIFERAPWVSLVCGSASYRKLPELLSQIESGNRRVMGLSLDTDETFETELTRRDNPYRAYLTIIEGCDKACTYCVVPRTRGPERSRRSDSILDEVKQLADFGYSEIQLLGQTVNSYKDPRGRFTFAELLAAVAQTSGIRRVRFTTSHPRDFGPDIVAAMDSVHGICNHIHIPVQSGSARVLREMARTYTRDEYLQIIALIRGAKREIALSTDIIVGFPTETEADFAETLSLMDAVQYDSAFSFKFSPRPNTPAQHLPDNVPEAEKSRRLAVFQEHQRAIQIALHERLIGQTFEVMVDGRGSKEGQWSGRTSCNRTVNFNSTRGGLLGEYVQVRVTRGGPNSLIGEEVHRT